MCKKNKRRKELLALSDGEADDDLSSQLWQKNSG